MLTDAYMLLEVPTYIEKFGCNTYMLREFNVLGTQGFWKLDLDC